MTYWITVGRTAALQAGRDLRLNSSSGVLVHVASQLVIFVVVFTALPEAIASNAWTRGATAVAPLLLYPIAVLVRLVLEPPRLDSAKEEELKRLRAELADLQSPQPDLTLAETIAHFQMGQLTEDALADIKVRLRDLLSTGRLKAWGRARTTTTTGGIGPIRTLTSALIPIDAEVWRNAEFTPWAFEADAQQNVQVEAPSLYGDQRFSDVHLNIAQVRGFVGPSARAAACYKRTSSAP